MKAAALVASLAFASVVFAHPMGNFSVNHYARLEPGAKGLTITYVLDLAELPTTELIQSWGVDRDSARAVMEAQASAQARQWAANLKVTENGKPILGIVESTQLAMEPGAANLPIYRISERIHFLAKGGRIEYEDGNYSTRAGWREIVVRAAGGAELQSASNGPDERSQALTSYPKDQEKSPPQDSKAWLEWRATAAPTAPVTAVQRQAEAPAPRQAEGAYQAPKAYQAQGADQAEGADQDRAAWTLAIVLGLIALLFVVRRFTRTRYPVA